MQLRAELVHAEPGVRVVQLSAWRNGECLGSTLAEAATVEQAERQAEKTLLQRLGAEAQLPNRQPAAHTAPPIPPSPPAKPQPASASRPAAAASPSQPAAAPVAEASTTEPTAPATPPAPAPPATAAEPQPLDPEDWSDELAQIELQLQRVGWNREQEGLYLERAFGHRSRNRLTTYADLVAYGQALAGFPTGADAATMPVPLRRRDLLGQCDTLLAQLGWDGNRGRGFLEQHFRLSSRSQLNDEQLLQFNMLLESELIGVGDTAASPASGEHP